VDGEEDAAVGEGFGLGGFGFVARNRGVAARQHHEASRQHAQQRDHPEHAEERHAALAGVREGNLATGNIVFYVIAQSVNHSAGGKTDFIIHKIVLASGMV
jgi:hypothetical protein